MTPRELRRALRQRKKELRGSLPKLRRLARERAEQNPAIQREKRRRRIRRTLIVAALILLALLLRCDCQPAPPPPVVVVEPEVPEPKPKPKVAPAPAKRPPLKASLPQQPRADFDNGPRRSPNWLDDFRLQVSARSPRLAQCFTGTDGPGALRWTTSVNPESGAVSDHDLAPVGPGAELSAKQRECVLKALSNPPYRLNESVARGLPDRISLVIEF